jgi:hypothetical protein
VVPGAGVEPARSKAPRDFKSLVSTDSTTRALAFSFSIQMVKSSIEKSALLGRLGPFCSGSADVS